MSKTLLPYQTQEIEKAKQLVASIRSGKQILWQQDVETTAQIIACLKRSKLGCPVFAEKIGAHKSTVSRLSRGCYHHGEPWSELTFRLLELSDELSSEEEETDPVKVVEGLVLEYGKGVEKLYKHKLLKLSGMTPEELDHVLTEAIRSGRIERYSHGRGVHYVPAGKIFLRETSPVETKILPPKQKPKKADQAPGEPVRIKFCFLEVEGTSEEAIRAAQKLLAEHICK